MAENPSLRLVLKRARDVLGRGDDEDLKLVLMTSVKRSVLAHPAPSPEAQAAAEVALEAALQLVRDAEAFMTGAPLPSRQRREAIDSLLVVDMGSLPERREAIRMVLDWVHGQPKFSQQQKAKLVAGTAKAYLGNMGRSDAAYAAVLPLALAAVQSMDNARGRGKKAPIKKNDAIAALFAHFGYEVKAATARKRKATKV